MTFRTPLRQRLGSATRRKNRYWSDPEYRLQIINRERERRGMQRVYSLDEIGPPRRDEQGRFA